MRGILGLGFFASLMLWTGAALADCNQPATAAVMDVSVPGHPFSAIPTADGCTIFVSLTGKLSHIAVLKRDRGSVSVANVAAVEGSATGMALSPDGRFLAVANGDGVLLFDATALSAGKSSPLFAMNDGEGASSIYAAFSRDGHLLFVANERSASISLYDVSSLPAAPRLIGKLGTGGAPVGLAFSPDGQRLYSTSEAGPRTWAMKCSSEGPPHPQGILLVYDIAKAAADPKTGMVAGVAAGCNSVRVALSPDGGTAYVTARGDNALHVFDTAALGQDPTHALKTAITVGSAPVGVATAGGNIFVTNSNRFGGSDHQTVSVLDAAHPDAPARAIPAGGFPRELKVTADGNTLLVTNFGTQTLELVDLKRLDEAAK